MTAFISGNTFQALNVALTTGANVITVTVQDTSGNLSSASITVTGTGTLVDPVQLQANLTNGFSPLSVTFQAQASVPGTIQQVLYDFAGNDAAFQTNTSLSQVS